MSTICFVTGGARSGKSGFAESRALELMGDRNQAECAYLATGEALDEEFSQRIAHHRQSRDRRFRTIEEGLHLAAAMETTRAWPGLDGRPVVLLGPVSAIAGMTATTWIERTIRSQPRKGTVMQVEVPTHVSGLLHFASGVQASITTSFDVKGGHGHAPIEIYGSEGSLQVPDPNTFGGPVRYRRAGAVEWTELPLLKDFAENSRGLGVADLVDAWRGGRQPRAGGELTLHILEIMHGIHLAAEKRAWHLVKNQCAQPTPL
jgi:adenosyl cobinamide kinase/adenosyl cobinamide phosphate guanylyltransferase